MLAAIWPKPCRDSADPPERSAGSFSPFKNKKVVANAPLKENAIRLDFLPKIIAYRLLAMRQTTPV
ncbi:hypothetical protein [Vibrio mediterranei]|uniref:hypothetical protein n=1 Tax=Vibrio mediterranei TaxID=689 RepID=UPI001EFD9C51|nr:hypothetical protein [Vibrio mediterranei]MCG9660125.1 hypothetical protein [Vibrio mediterranei]